MKGILFINCARVCICMFIYTYLVIFKCTRSQMKEGEQMWQRNVAAGLVEEVGMGPFLIANGEDDAVCRGILWLLNPDLIRAGSEHLERCQREQSGYFNRESVPKDLEAGLVEAF